MKNSSLANSAADTYLRGVLGLPMIRRGERIFGSNENFSLMFSRTDGATYVKPYINQDAADTVGAQSHPKGRKTLFITRSEAEV